MIKKLFIMLLMGVTTLLFAQTVAPKKCSTCGKPLVQCQYKGRHPKPTTGSHRGHEWVDLGLPSGTKWATMNVGANSPNDYGSYFAWGETSPKRRYDWSNLKYCLGDSGDENKFSKYVIDGTYGNVDGKKELDLCDDVAHVNWGSGWRMPSKSELDELCDKCKWTWTTMGENEGYKVIGPNGNSIFLPAAGWAIGSGAYGFDSRGYYWSRTLCTAGAYKLYLISSDITISSNGRLYGHTVRPVVVH